ncbi:DoxX protein [Pseudotenacibaculum sp. MALMAid0570]|uniref:DoxX protein n=1 Tax=Pseudotenacibaculum sp. MALMAid0570 TaxID=3143938 RepID=UPI0032DF88EE
MNSIAMIARYLLGLAMLVFGANKFFHFMPNPDLPEAAGAFMGALGGSGYIFPTLGVVYILAGLLLVINRAVPFALIILVPVSFNIVAFHLKYAPEGILFAAIVAVLNLFLIYTNWDRFKSLFE